VLRRVVRVMFIITHQGAEREAIPRWTQGGDTG